MRDAPAQELRVPAQLRRGARKHDESASVASAVWLLDHMCEHLGLSNLADREVLDFGCGVKFTQALINHKMPIQRYVGIDVEPDVVRFLQENVTDPRFEFYLINARNDLYNPSGTQLTVESPLPIDGQLFDVICLFSVFTHLAPHDYRILLTLLRRFAKSDTKLFFTLYLSERSEAGHGVMDRWDSILRNMSSDDVARYAENNPTSASPIETFKDLDPQHPLTWAVYAEPFARELIEGTGWRPVELSPPDEFIQHHFTCVVA